MATVLPDGPKFFIKSFCALFPPEAIVLKVPNHSTLHCTPFSPFPLPLRSPRNRLDSARNGSFWLSAGEELCPSSPYRTDTLEQRKGASSLFCIGKRGWKCEWEGRVHAARKKVSPCPNIKRDFFFPGQKKGILQPGRGGKEMKGRGGKGTVQRFFALWGYKKEESQTTEGKLFDRWGEMDR